MILRRAKIVVLHEQQFIHWVVFVARLTALAFFIRRSRHFTRFTQWHHRIYVIWKINLVGVRRFVFTWGLAVAKLLVEVLRKGAGEIRDFAIVRRVALIQFAGWYSIRTSHFIYVFVKFKAWKFEQSAFIHGGSNKLIAPDVNTRV